MNKLGINYNQPSTWRGIVMMLAGTGISVLPQSDMVWFLPLCLVVTGALGVFVRD